MLEDRVYFKGEVKDFWYAGRGGTIPSLICFRILFFEFFDIFI